MLEFPPPDDPQQPFPPDTLRTPGEVYSVPTNSSDLGGLAAGPDIESVDTSLVGTDPDRTPDIPGDANESDQLPPITPAYSEPVSATPHEPTTLQNTAANDIPPIDIPPIETTQPEFPERGRALSQLMDYAARSGDEIRNTLKAIVRDNDRTRAMLELMDPDLDPDYAINIVVDMFYDTLNVDLRTHATNNVSTYGQLQYGDALAATGLTLHSDLEQHVICLEMTDPAAYTAALQQVEQPTDTTTRHRVDEQQDAILETALERATFAIMSNDPVTTMDMCGGEPPIDLFSPSAYSPAEDTAFTEALAAQATPLANALDRLNTPQELSEPLRYLDMARRENLTTAWAVGYELAIIGHGTDAVVDALGSLHDSQATYAYFAYLQRNAPDSQFSREVRTALLEKIDAAITILRHRIAAARFGQDGYMQSLTTLEAAQQRIRHIMPD